MGIVWSKRADEILKVGIWLGEELANWALTKSQALNTLHQLFDSQIAVFGGDVLDYKDGVFKFSYDSWSCNQVPEESEMDYLIRSIEKARSYIEDYPIPENCQIYFIIVPKTEQ